MADIIWTKVQVVLTDVPMEYMECNSDAFVGGDEVIIEFTDQDWDQPKVMGFKEAPRLCNSVYNFPAISNPRAGENKSRTRKLNYNSEAWTWKATFPQSYSFANSSDRGDYAATGENGLGFTLCGRSYADYYWHEEDFDHLDIFDSVTETFSTGNDHPQEKRQLIFESLNNGKCISHGGRTGTLNQELGIIATYHPETHRYLVSTNSWERAANGVAVYDHASFIIDGVLYAVGGSLAWGGVPFNGTKAYYNEFDSWHTVTTSQQSAWLSVNGYSLEGKGLIGGGALVYNQTEIADTYLYDADSKAWTKKADGFSSSGLQGTATALNQTVALQFSPGGSSLLTHWADYKLSTNTWRDRGVYGNIVGYFDGDPDRPVYGNRRRTASAEL